MAPEFTPRRWKFSRAKANVRLLKIAFPRFRTRGATDWERGRNAMDAKRIGSGLLLQTADNHELSLADLKVVTKKQPTPKKWKTCCSPGRWPSTSRATPSSSARAA
jgi:phosphoribosylaminoimidazolecarboxamide formyltransferase/IMP cyclohydrolase